MSSFYKDFTKVASAPIITQILSVILTPIITRLFPPESFGIAQLFGSITSPLMVFITMGYAIPIMIAESEEERINLFIISISFSMSISIVIGLLFFAGYDLINQALNIDQIKIIIWILPLSLFLHGLYLSLRYWNLKNANFQQNALGEISRNLGNYLIVVPIGFLGFTSAKILIIGGFVSSITAIFALSFKQLKLLRNKFVYYFNYECIKRLLVRYRRFSFYNTPSDLLSRITSEAPVVFYAFFFSSNVIGFYSLSLRVLSLPIKYLGSSIGEVYFQRASFDKSGNEKLLNKILTVIFILCFPFFSTISIIGSELFSFIFGQPWRNAGQYSQVLSFYIFVKLITSLASYLTNILEKPDYYFIYIILDTLFIFTGIIIGGILKNIFISLFMVLLLSGTVNLVFARYMYSLIGVSIKGVWIKIRQSIILSLICVVIMITLKILFINNGLMLIILSGILLFMNYLLLAIFEPEIREILRKLLGLLRNKYFQNKRVKFQ